MSKLTSKSINYIVDKVPTPNSIDGVSGKHARKNIVAGIKKQLVEYDGVVDQTQDILDELIDYMVTKELESLIPDHVRYGLRASEALTVGIGNALQKLFSSVDKKSGKTLDLVKRLDTVLRTVNNRIDQLLTVHFDREYAKERNFSLQDIADMRLRFVRTTIDDVLLKTTANDQNGYIVGILEPFDGDETTNPSPTLPRLPNGENNTMRKHRAFVADRDAAPLISVKPWNKAAMGTPARSYMIGCIRMMRIFFDADLLYSRKITISKIVGILAKSMPNIAYVVGSSGKEPIIDIFPANLSSQSNFSNEDNEKILLGTTIPFNFPNIVVSGVEGITALDIVQVELDKIISVRRANSYYVEEAALKDIPFTRTDIDKYSILIDPGTHQPGDFYLGDINNKVCVIRSPLPLSQQSKENVVGAEKFYPAPSEEQLSDLLVRRVAGPQGLENLWACQLDNVAIANHCLDLELIEEMLEYCGLDTVFETDHETLVNGIDKIYVRSNVDPREVIEKHKSADNYTSKNILSLSEKAKQRVVGKAKESGMHVEKLLELPGYLELGRIFKYYYATMSCVKGDKSKTNNPVFDHINPHPFWNVISFPFVDKTKTTCNDPHTMNFSCGTVIARNNLLVELQQLYSGQNIDRRYLELLADWMFEFGEPAGIGYHGSKKHGVGAISSISQEQSETQLVSIAHNKPPESINMLAPSFMMSMPPKGVDIAGVSHRERTVQMFKREREEVRYRVSKAYNRIENAEKSLSLDKPSSDRSLDFVVYTRLLETDPYLSIPTFRIAGDFASPIYPRSFSLRLGVVKHENSQILQQISDGLLGTISRLSNIAPIEERKEEKVVITGDFADIIDIYNYLLSSAFDDVYKTTERI